MKIDRGVIVKMQNYDLMRNLYRWNPQYLSKGETEFVFWRYTRELKSIKFENKDAFSISVILFGISKASSKLYELKECWGKMKK